MNKKVTSALLIAVLLLLMTATPVLADGAFFSPTDYDMSESVQRAVIIYASVAGNVSDNVTGNATEHLILSVSFMGNAEHFAWVIPVPGKPEITLADPDLFWELSDFTTKDLPEPGHWFGCFYYGGTNPPGEDGVDVIEEKVVGPYATAILAATNTTALIDWLWTKGYSFPTWGYEVISEYVEKEWYFVATRINAVDEDTGHALEEGAIEPIVLSFKSDEIVYPLRITSLNPEPPDTLLYVLADHVMIPEQYPLYIGYGDWHSNAFTLEFGQNVSVEELFEYEVLPELVSTHLTATEFSLTKLRGWIHPDHMMDIEFVTYTGTDSLDSLAQTNTKDDDAFVVTMIIGPAFGLYLWRRRRATTI